MARSDKAIDTQKLRRHRETFVTSIFQIKEGLSYRRFNRWRLQRQSGDNAHKVFAFLTRPDPRKDHASCASLPIHVNQFPPPMLPLKRCWREDAMWWWFILWVVIIWLLISSFGFYGYRRSYHYD